MRSAEKRLDEMNRLADMLHFPAAVNAGATANVMMTIAVTWYFAHGYFNYVAVWMAVVLAINLLPVVLLRLSLTPTTSYPALKDMDFVHDQHKFSDWVYLAASANMAFWILLAWTIEFVSRSTGTLLWIEGAAFLITFSPVMLRNTLGLTDL